MANSASLLDQMLERYEAMEPNAKQELTDLVLSRTKDMRWIPTVGPQYDAVMSPADVLLYGGSGGSGKSDLLVGIASTEHQRSLLIRKHYTDLGALIDRAKELNVDRVGFNGSPPPRLTNAESRIIDFGGVANLGDEQHWQGHPHDLIGIDEVVQLARSQVDFLIGWNRGPDGQRKRVILASNPPVGSQGTWIIEMFAPWLDPRHENPAKHGELRWFVTVGTADEGSKDLEVDPDTFYPSKASDKFGRTVVNVDGEELEPLSRTFIPGSLSDNPFLRDSGYGAKLDGLPEPMRSAIRDGNFMAARMDDSNQMIPTSWIQEAQSRWLAYPPHGIPMCGMGVDVARSSDETVVATRYDGYYPELIGVPGKTTPHGTDVAALVIKHRQHQAVVVIDVGEGTGGQAFAHLQNNEVEVRAYRGMDPSIRRTEDNQLRFTNLRTEAYWRFREALDPGQPGGSPISLPDDPKLMSDLAAVTWELTPRGIQALSKKKVVEKLGRSPDRGDAVIMAWTAGPKAITHAAEWRDDQRTGKICSKRKSAPTINMGKRRSR